MTITAQESKRYFDFNGLNLPDPGAMFTVDEVKQMFSNAYPDLLTAVVETELVADGVKYNFIRNVGTKG
jgi:PRTRC genetic system protein C